MRGRQQSQALVFDARSTSLRLSLLGLADALDHLRRFAREPLLDRTAVVLRRVAQDDGLWLSVRAQRCAASTVPS